MAAPKTYRATSTIYVDERFIREGEIFTTTAPKGETWEEIEADKPARGRKPAEPATAADD